MRIEHLAIWVTDLELMRRFYETSFGATSGEKYHNPKTNFSSYFLSFETGCRLQLMQKPEITAIENRAVEQLGISHFAVSVGSSERVNELTQKLRTYGFTIAGNPGNTGDGYYESVVLDPEKNSIEITI